MAAPGGPDMKVQEIDLITVTLINMINYINSSLQRKCSAVEK